MEAVREEEIHPLQNSSILEVIFKNLNLGDLKSCRLVCREWCRGSTIAMKEVPSMVRILEVDGKRISDFMELVRVEGEENAFEVPPFMKDFEIRTLEGDSRMFWEICGSNLKSLRLSGVCFQSGDTFRHAIFQSCPNLEALSLNPLTVMDVNAEEPKEWVPPRFPPNRNLKFLQVDNTRLGGVSWMEVLSQFPALEVHVVYGVSSLAGFFGSLALARGHDDQCWKIKDLTFSMDGIEDPLVMVPVFEELNLPLEKLTVFMIDRIVDVIALQRLLAVHAPKLTELKLAGEDFTGSPVMELFPLPNNAVFDNVTHLQLFFASLPSVTFLQLFPNLKELKLMFARPLREFSQEPLGNWVISRCTKLVMLMLDLETEDVRQVISRLPNLESLCVHTLNNDTFQVICELLPNLVEFDFAQCEIDDIGISGLDEEDVARINEEGSGWPITVARPNLTGLMNLKRFRMCGRGNMELGYTTALCVQRLPHLQQLCLEGYEHLHPILEDLQTQFPWTPQ